MKERELARKVEEKTLRIFKEGSEVGRRENEKGKSYY